jgi:MATE family multidrug resistance protein
VEDRSQRRGLLTRRGRPKPDAAPAGDSPFTRHPHRTFVGLSLPVLISLVPEPLAGAVDTAFVKQLGAAPAAGLAAATALLSSVFWVFNFLGIGTQTEVAQALGRDDAHRAADTAGLALAVAAALGVALALLGWPCLEAAARFMSGEPAVQDATADYLAIRLLGGPAVLIMLAGFGVLRGLQDMRTPLWIALVSSTLNIGLDPLLIFGSGPFPRLGIAGAAWATVASQWLAAVWTGFAVRRRLGPATRLDWREAGSLFVVGRDLFLRTGLLILFLLLATRAATRIGAEVGAAHQGVRQVWLLTAFVLDAYAAAAQSLVAWFVGAARVAEARRVAAVACAWGTGTGVLLAALMLVGESAVASLLVPAAAHGLFGPAWLVAALAQPANGLAFVTDGIHWATRDYRFLRNVMFAATVCGAILLFGFRPPGADELRWIWLVTSLWIGIRAAFGVARVWPGLGASPLARRH